MFSCHMGLQRQALWRRSIRYPNQKITEDRFKMKYGFDMWYGDKCATFDTVEKVMNEPFFDGKTIEEIIPDMVDYDEG